MTTNGTWLTLTEEAAIEPNMPVIDAHHHLWQGYGEVVPWQPDYWLDEFAADLDGGHNVVATVFIECGYGYSDEDDPLTRPVGETAVIEQFARDYEKRYPESGQACAAIVGHVDLSAGYAVIAALEAHLDASPDRFRGIRQITNWDPSEEVRYPGFQIQPELLLDASFQKGFSTLSKLGLSFDAWLFHPQLPELDQLARRFPDTTIIVDHFGGPVGIGPYAEKQDEVFLAWQRDIARLAENPNVMMKLGGIHMTHAGFGWHERPHPPSSDELQAATKHYYLHAIDCFGPERCMFESNFPVDKVSCSYSVVWNTYKKICSEFSETERQAMLHDNAARVYGISETRP